MSLQGPTEAKFQSKQDPARAYIEVSLKDTTNRDSIRNLDKMKQDVKSVLEDIIQLDAYPKTILNFQIFIIKDGTNGA